MYSFNNLADILEIRKIRVVYQTLVEVESIINYEYDISLLCTTWNSFKNI